MGKLCHSNIFVTVATFIFCLNNYKWNEPWVDFRPYKIGTNIIQDKEMKKYSLLIMYLLI